MLRKCLYIAVCCTLAVPVSVAGAETQADFRQSGSFERGTVLKVKEAPNAAYFGTEVKSSTVRQLDQGLVIEDGKGGIIILPGQESYGVNSQVLDARELKLKVRELASQLVSDLDKSLVKHIALPLAFVSQDDFTRTSSFGRYISEQLYYEFNQRGLRTKEYRLAENVSVREDGEFVLTRDINGIPLDSNTVYVVGTYYTDGQILLVNARLIRANGDILRTGQLILGVNQLTKRMLANSGRKMQVGNLKVQDFNTEARPPETVTAFDMGMDIH